MSMRPLNDLLQIVRSGGSLDLQAGNLSRDELTELVRNTRENKATVVLRGLDTRSTDELVHISRNSMGSVIFVLD